MYWWSGSTLFVTRQNNPWSHDAGHIYYNQLWLLMTDFLLRYYLTLCIESFCTSTISQSLNKAIFQWLTAQTETRHLLYKNSYVGQHFYNQTAIGTTNVLFRKWDNNSNVWFCFSAGIILEYHSFLWFIGLAMGSFNPFNTSDDYSRRQKHALNA